jgi:hypothetical protein
MLPVIVILQLVLLAGSLTPGTPGYVVRCGLASVCSKAVWQATDSRSTPESEIIAAGKEVKEQQHIHALAPQMGRQ